jgi:hypothetical protein
MPMDILPKLCDFLNMHILVISEDMSYHFKFMDLCNGKAYEILKNEKDFLDREKFVEWWFLPLRKLKSFK